MASHHTAYILMLLEIQLLGMSGMLVNGVGTESRDTRLKEFGGVIWGVTSLSVVDMVRISIC